MLLTKRPAGARLVEVLEAGPITNHQSQCPGSRYLCSSTGFLDKFELTSLNRWEKTLPSFFTLNTKPFGQN
jgi:hypothetical protein